MTIAPAPMCLSCRHYDAGTPAEVGGQPKCVAFPAGIPEAIYWEARIDHRQPWAGDGGIRFEQGPELDVFDFDVFEEVRGPAPIRSGPR